ncbi:MAG: hypothetical protein U0K71_08785 [Paludibacteraceae bacterium]|nr:hypothetical protein [Paludibacteraceae bacterium]
MGQLLTLEYIPFDFWDYDLKIESCFELAYEKLKGEYGDYLLFSSDFFGISIIAENGYSCGEIAIFSTGRIGKYGPLAMRNEFTNEVTVL